MNAIFDHVAFDGAPHVADSLGGFAIAAQPGFDTGILVPEADIINRCGVVLDPGHGRLQVGGHLLVPFHLMLIHGIPPFHFIFIVNTDTLKVVSYLLKHENQL
jgi:hypothetical protein